MDDSVARFYDDLAEHQHLVFADWEASLVWQADVLERVIRAQLGPAARSVLDCSCGIGTQAIGLAGRGFAVHATDISRAAVARAAREAAARGVPLTTGVADLRALDREVGGTFDVVLSCDNALPHLMTDADLHQALRAMWTKTAPDGLLLASIRDYDRILAERPRAELPRVFDDPEGRRIVFQVWDWDADSRSYTLSLFILRQNGDAWHTIHHATRYRALPRHELTAALQAAGFSDVRWLMPEAGGYYQPLVTARRRAERAPDV
jgi:glycine/sarcosine N-methyltransferase